MKSGSPGRSGMGKVEQCRYHYNHFSSQKEASMRVALVGSEIEENLSLRYLASALRRAEHKVTIVPFGCPEEKGQALQIMAELRPDLIGLSIVFQKRAMEFMELAVSLREEGYRGHITCGGHFPTFSYRELLAHCTAIDSAVRHEGEETIVELASALEKGSSLSEINGLVFRSLDDCDDSFREERSSESETAPSSIAVNPPRIPADNLDILSFPARDFAPRLHLGIPTAPLVGSRGCYGDCSFCCINAWHRTSGGKKFRRRDPAMIAEEMSELYHGRGVRIFIFHDDNFFTAVHEENMNRIAALRREMESRGLDEARIVVKARPDNVERRLFSLLKDMGLLRVYLGIENNSPGGIAALNRKVKPEDNERAITILHELDIFTCYNILLFDPSTKPVDIEHNIRFMEKHNYYPYNFCRTEVYVSSTLQTVLRAGGNLLGDYLSSDYVIEENRMEVLFRIVASAFYERNFLPDGVANANMGLGYSLHLLKAFYKEAYSPDLGKRAAALTSEINDTGLEFLTEAFEFVMKEEPRTIRTVQSFTADLSARIIASNYHLVRRLEALEREIAERAYYSASPCPALNNTPARRESSLLRCAASIPACLALTLMSSGCLPQVCDPAPPPGRTASPSAPAPSSFPATDSQGSGNLSGMTPTPPVVDPLPPPATAAPRKPSSQTPARLTLASGRYDLGPLLSYIEGYAVLDDNELTMMNKPSVAASAGEITDATVSPDCKHLSFKYRAAKSQAPGPVTITVTFPTMVTGRNSCGIKDIITTGKLYVYEDSRLSLGETPIPKEQRGMVVDFAPPPSHIVDSTSSVDIECTEPDNPVVNEKGGMATYGLGTSSLEFIVHLNDTVKGNIGKPAISATLGTVTPSPAYGGGRNFTFLYALPSANDILKAGTATIRVRIPVECEGKVHKFENSIKVTIKNDGTVTLPCKGKRRSNSSQAGGSTASLPRSIYGSLEKKMGKESRIILAMNYCYTGTTDESCLPEGLAPNQWRGHDGVILTWEAETGSIRLHHDGTVQWILAETQTQAYMRCTCTGPDGSVWSRSINCSHALA